MSLLQKFEREGVVLTPKLTFKSEKPLDANMLAFLQAHKDELLRELAAPDTLPRLPWQLERLVSAASSNVLEIELRGVPGPNRYTLGWAASYLTGDRQEALSRLWQVRRVWQREALS